MKATKKKTVYDHIIFEYVQLNNLYYKNMLLIRFGTVMKKYNRMTVK